MNCRLKVLTLLFFSSLFLLQNAGAAIEEAPNASQEGAAKAQPVVLSQALARVFENHPQLKASELEIQAASARLLQAGYRPNPELSATAENILAVGGPGLFGAAESTLQLSQRLELGGKRELRIRAGESDKTVAGRRLELEKAELIAKTSLAFADVLAGQELLSNQRELTLLARKAHAIVVERVAAGKVSPVEITRSTVALASSQLEEEKQLLLLTAAKDRLAGLWGGTQQDVGTVQGRFEIPDLLSPASAPCTEGNLEIQVASAAVEYRRSLLALELSSRKPDVTISAGFRRLNLEAQEAWVAGASIPLPIFDRRQGAAAEARILIEKSQAEKRAVEWRVRAGMAQAQHALEIARLEVRSLVQTALPAARDAAQAVEEGYRFGKFDFINVLDAQRTNAELQRRYIEAVASGLTAAIEMDRLRRCDVSTISPHPGAVLKEVIHE
jgi:outer membrane protein, heavy metal efflux system